MDEESSQEVDELMEAVDAWAAAVGALSEAISGRASSIRRAERQLQIALRCFTLRRWMQLQSGAVSISSPRVSRDLHLAARVKSDVVRALTDLGQVRAESSQELAEARSRLSTAAGGLVPFGRCAERTSGLAREELERLAADRPSQMTSQSPVPVTSDQRRYGVATRDQVRDFQRRIAMLDSVHGRAKEHLAAVERRRAAAIAAQDVLVAEARHGVDAAVAEMAREVGVDLAASLTGRDVSDVRRVLRREGASAD